MKGGFSSPNSALETFAFCSLYPDTPYGVMAAGDPKHIPDLTYEQFKAFHARHYHPSPTPSCSSMATTIRRNGCV